MKERFAVSALTAMMTLALCYFVFLPIERDRLSHLHNVELAELCARHMEQFLNSDPDFAEVRAAGNTEGNGSLLLYGVVPNDEAITRLETLARKQEYPVDIVFHVETIPEVIRNAE
ncbi:MAG: hypothetical protein AAF585_02645 [Verrucomicrobiota bacterium]